MFKSEYIKIAKRFSNVMNIIGCEYLDITNPHSEVYSDRRYYSVEDGITISWMYSEACYWLSCYYESGNVRCDDKKYDPKGWRCETGYLKRLIIALEKFPNDDVIEER